MRCMHRLSWYIYNLAIGIQQWTLKEYSILVVKVMQPQYKVYTMTPLSPVNCQAAPVWSPMGSTSWPSLGQESP